MPFYTVKPPTTKLSDQKVYDMYETAKLDLNGVLLFSAQAMAALTSELLWLRQLLPESQLYLKSTGKCKELLDEELAIVDTPRGDLFKELVHVR